MPRLGLAKISLLLLFLIFAAAATTWLYSSHPKLWFRPDFPPEIEKVSAAATTTISVDTNGTQAATIAIGSADAYIGAAFELNSNAAATIKKIVVTDTGTVNANQNLANVELWYEEESCGNQGAWILFGTTSFDVDERAEFTGSMPLTPSPMCLHVTFDVASGAHHGDTVELEITYPGAHIVADRIVGWASTASMLSPRTQFGSALYNGYLYVVGGDTPTESWTSTVMVGTISTTTGAITSWQYTTPLPDGVEGNRAFAYNGYLYSICGYADGGTFPDDNVFYAAIQGDGTVSSWATTSAHLACPEGFGIAIADGYFYTIAGNKFGNKDDVYFAKINATGSLGTWVQSTDYPGRAYGFNSVSYGDRLYGFGGFFQPGSVDTSSVFSASLAATGSVEAWGKTDDLPTTLVHYGIDTDQNVVFITGGSESHTTSGTETSTVLAAAIDPGGSLGPWNTDVSFPDERRRHGFSMYSGYAYAYGGTVDCCTSASSVLFSEVRWFDITPSTPVSLPGTTVLTDYLTIAATGTQIVTVVQGQTSTYLGGAFMLSRGITSTMTVTQLTFTDVGSVTSSKDLSNIRIRYEHAPTSTCFYNGNESVYGVSQFGSSERMTISSTFSFSTTSVCIYFEFDTHATATINRTIDIQIADPSEDIAIGRSLMQNFATPTPHASTYHQALAYSGYMYMIGGSPPGERRTSSVHYVAIDPGGALGAWNDTTPLPASVGAGIERHGSAVYNGYAYVLGGLTQGNVSGVETSTVWFAPINVNGTLGAWSETTPMPSWRRSLSSVALNGYLYVVGGYSPDEDETSTVLYAPINATGSIGAWSETTPYPIRIGSQPVITVDDLIYSFGGSGSGKENDVYFADPDGSGAIPSWTQTTDLPVQLTDGGAAYYNGFVWYFGGGTGSPTEARSSTYYARVNATGSLGAWKPDVSMSQPMMRGSILQYEGFMYALAGENAGSGTTSTVLYGSIYATEITPGTAVGINGITTILQAAASSGYMISPIYDTQNSSGSQLNSFLWNGTLPTDTSVQFQFAVSQTPSGPWSYIGPDGTDTTVYTALPNSSVALDPLIFTPARYFRYKVFLNANPAVTLTPAITDIIVNWSR